MLPPPSFTLTLRTAVSVDQAWIRLWNLDAHSRLIPFTRVSPTDAAGGSGLHGVGDHFVARTHVGRWGFDDAMVVREWTPPRRAVIDKLGTPLHGRIEVTLTATAHGSVVRWHQTYSAVGVHDGVAWLVQPFVRTGYARVLRRLLRTAGEADAA